MARSLKFNLRALGRGGCHSDLCKGLLFGGYYFVGAIFRKEVAATDQTVTIQRENEHEELSVGVRRDTFAFALALALRVAVGLPLAGVCPGGLRPSAALAGGAWGRGRGRGVARLGAFRGETPEERAMGK